MEVVSCLNPKRVYNKYRDEYVTVSCGSCPACARKKSSIWVQRLENEAQCSRFVFFVTLTYDNLHLPLLTPDLPIDDTEYHSGIFNKKTRFVSERDSISIPFGDLTFADTKDLSYFHRAFLLFNGIPYASKKDVQLFNKRLNKYFYEKVSNKYQNFRFFLVSELGSCTFRPHFHAIYFTNDQRCADHFGEAIRKSWQRNGLSLGRIDCQFVKGSASNYVAQYINGIFNSPSFYAHDDLKPFYLQSRRPSIGNVKYTAEDLRSLFESGFVRQIVPDPKNRTSFIDVPFERFVEDRLYPKFSYFSQVSDSLRVKLYRVITYFCSKPYGSKQSLKIFVKNVLDSLVNVSFSPKSAFADLWQYLKLITSNCETAFDNLKRLYYVSRRFLYNCALYNISEYAYYLKILSYYKRKEKLTLKKFYQFQSDFMSDTSVSNDLEDLVHLYPDFAFMHSDCVKPFSDLSAFRKLTLDSLVYKIKATKSHLKNHYLDKIKHSNKPLYSLIKLYHYA